MEGKPQPSDVPQPEKEKPSPEPAVTPPHVERKAKSAKDLPPELRVGDATSEDKIDGKAADPQQSNSSQTLGKATEKNGPESDQKPADSTSEPKQRSGLPLPNLLLIVAGVVALLAIAGLLPVFGYLVYNLASYDYSLLDRQIDGPLIATPQAEKKYIDKPNLPSDYDRFAAVEPPEDFTPVEKARWDTILKMTELGLPRAIDLQPPGFSASDADDAGDDATAHVLQFPNPGVRQGMEITGFDHALPGIRAAAEALQKYGVSAQKLAVRSPQKDGSVITWTLLDAALQKLDTLDDDALIKAVEEASGRQGSDDNDLVRVDRKGLSAKDAKHLKYSKYYWSRGVRFAKKDDKKNALDQFKRAWYFTKWPDFARSLGIAHSELGQEDEAANFYGKSLQGNPYDAGLLNAFLLSLNRLNDHQEVLRLTDEWKRRPGWTEAERASLLYHRGFAQGRLRQFEDAERTLRAYLQIRPEESFASFLLGLAINAQGRPQGALPFLHTAASANPTDPDQRFALAQAQAKAGRSRSAISSFETYRGLLAGVREPPLEFYTGLAEAHLDLNQIQDAASAASEGIRLYGSTAELLALQRRIREASQP